MDEVSAYLSSCAQLYASLVVAILSKNPALDPTSEPNRMLRRILRWNLRRNLRRKRIRNLGWKCGRNRCRNLGPDPPSDPMCILTGKFVSF